MSAKPVDAMSREVPGILKLTVTALAAIAAAIVLTGCGVFGMSEEPPESEYTQAEAYAPMEQAVVDTIAVLPDFPGFTARSWRELPCSHNGVDDPDYTNIEISYSFGKELSADPKVREDYIDVLREHWAELGYTTRTDEGDGAGFHDLSVKREDGIALWYKVWDMVGLVVQSGCVPVSDKGEIEYIPPAGGIEPGSDGDIVEEYFPDGIPTEETSDEAVAPFDHTTTAGLAGMVPWSREPDAPGNPTLGRYDGML
ncbi:hypothetical protein [Glycomyces tenuis]|uniref:hypothetical protein n=1 Tax=Glycomyces tenuis TaxID=58116 RepID=UPI0012DC201B|nr:hypothetical protein [Glycomyces tenuis]